MTIQNLKKIFFEGRESWKTKKIIRRVALTTDENWNQNLRHLKSRAAPVMLFDIYLVRTVDKKKKNLV